MTPALATAERIRRTEQVIAYLRAAVIGFNIVVYLVLGPAGERRSFALVIAGLSVVYAVLTLVWRPANDRATVGGAYASMIVDSALIGVWIYATGGYGSPFYPLFYAHAAASIGRFGAKVGGASAIASAVVYLAIGIFDGFDSGYVFLTRLGYIFLISAMVAYVAEVARTYERETAAAEREAASYRELDRLRSTFVTNISHELRTPLTVIRGAASTLVRNRPGLDGEDKTSLLEMIERHSEELGNLVQDIIDAGFVEQGKLALELGPADIGALVGEQVDLIRARSSRTIDFECPVASMNAICDPRKISNAFRKIVENALKFSGAEAPVWVGLVQDADHVVITVKDSGLGIPEDEHRRIFERFVQLDPSHTRSAGGTGLGLSIAQAIASLHGGDISVNSAVGEGSTFVMRIPKRLDVTMSSGVVELDPRDEPESEASDRANARLGR